MKTFSTTKEVLDEISKLKIKFNHEQVIPQIDSFVTPPPQTKWRGWRMNLTALKNSLHYCIDKLKIKFKLLIIVDGKLHSYLQVVPMTSPKEYLKYLRRLNPKLKWPKRFTYKNQMLIADKNLYKRNDLRFMNCIISKTEKMDEEDLFYIKRLNVVSERYSLPDGFYILAPTDVLILRNDGKEPWVDVVGGEKNLLSHNYKKFIPIFNGNSGLKYRDIPLPTYEDLQYLWNSEVNESMSRKYSWEQKMDKAVFRGSATGCGFSFNRNPRLKAALLGKKYPGYLDAGITAMKEKLKIDEKEGVGYTDLKKLSINFSNKLTPYEQSKYKYILHLDGNVAAHRLAKFFLLGSVTLLSETGSMLWFQHMLQPYVHYVPVSKDLDDLIDKIKWCRENDDKCREIAENAFELGKKVLTEEGCFGYIAKVFWDSRS